MSIPKRAAFLVATSVAAATVAAPALANPPSSTHHHPHHHAHHHHKGSSASRLHHTSLNARATKHAVAPGDNDPVVLTLRAGNTGIAGEQANFEVRWRHQSKSKWGTWAPVTAEEVAGTPAGRYQIVLTMPTSVMKGQKEQYQIEFTGDSVNHYAASRSEVFVVRAR